MPTVLSLLTHALEQMKLLGGIGDTLEDDIEHMHQISARFEAWMNWMKNDKQQAFTHSKMEAIQSHQEATTKIEEVKLESERNLYKKEFGAMCTDKIEKS